MRRRDELALRGSKAVPISTHLSSPENGVAVESPSSMFTEQRERKRHVGEERAKEESN